MEGPARVQTHLSMHERAATEPGRSTKLQAWKFGARALLSVRLCMRMPAALDDDSWRPSASVASEASVRLPWGCVEGWLLDRFQLQPEMKGDDISGSVIPQAQD